MRLSPVLFLVAVAACNSIGDPRDEFRARALAQIQANQAAWDSLGQRYYDFAYTKQCVCASATDRVLVHVRNGSVQSVTDGTGADVTARTGMDWPTVDSLFARAKSAISNTGLTTQLEFDAAYYYPSVIQSFDGSTGRVVRHVSTELAPIAVP